MSSSASSKSSEPPLPPGWSKGFSNSQKRHYYFHAETKHTQWHFPTASEAADPTKAKQRAQQNLREQQRSSAAKSSSASSSSDHKRRARPAEEEETTGLGDIVSSVTAVASSSRSASGGSQKRQKRSINTNFSAVESTLALADSTSVAIIVPYRDLHPKQNRAKHLASFIPHMHQFLGRQMSKGTISDYKIYIVEQSDDGLKFNRGKLLNIGFDVAKKHRGYGGSGVPHDVFIFHDVDLLPGDDLGSWYSRFPKSPIHIARVWGRYSNNPKYFGGVVSFSSSDMRRINGYPNTFWGWGGEDDEMQNRLEKLRIKWDYPPRGTLTDLEQMSLETKLDFLRENKEWKCAVKWEALEEHEKTWRTNGLADLSYDLVKNTDLDESGRAVKVTVNVKLNEGHWANEKAGVDFVWKK